MARREDNDADEGRGGKARAAVSRAAHPAAGGHPASRTARNQIYSPSARSQWNAADDPTGGDGPYQFIEYPKHVKDADGTVHTCLSAEHEAAITGAASEE
jgi:cytochrome c1